MALEVGSRIAHYSVTARIGEGGMGQVYQATDTKLGREVALKVLPEAFTADPDRLARFERESLRSWDLAPDGQRFLVVKSPSIDLRPQIVVVENWLEELERLVPVS